MSKAEKDKSHFIERAIATVIFLWLSLQHLSPGPLQNEEGVRERVEEVQGEWKTKYERALQRIEALENELQTAALTYADEVTALKTELLEKVKTPMEPCTDSESSLFSIRICKYHRTVIATWAQA